MTKKSVRKSAPSKIPRRKSARRTSGRYWSARVTKESDALDLEGGVFAGRDSKRIAASLKRSAERSRRRKSNPYRSALSMLTFYINRAGKNLSSERLKVLENAKHLLHERIAAAKDEGKKAAGKGKTRSTGNAA
jgi:hypothetical protein